MHIDPYNSIRHFIRVITNRLSRWPFFSKHTRVLSLAYGLVATDELIRAFGWLSRVEQLIFSCLLVMVSFTLQVCFFQMLWKTYVSNLLLPMLTIYFVIYAVGNFIIYEELSIIVPHLRWVQAILILIFSIASIYLLYHPVFRKLNDLPYNRLIGMCVGLVLYYVGVLVGWV